MALGPGILFASTCIGVSHLVQSTRAGADYGFALLIAIVVANVLKYPFFEFASRYTSATGVNILDGYLKEGRWILILYFLISLPSMFIVTAAVTFVTAGLLGNLLGLNLTTDIWSALLLGFCVIALGIGKYKLLDSLLKWVGAILLISVVAAFFSALINGKAAMVDGFVAPSVLEPAGIIFLIALMGWMPTAVDISTWTSLWAEEKAKVTGNTPSLKEASFDFNFGYWVSAILAICFMTLGAYVMHGTGTELSNNSTVFAGQVISLFTKSIGNWSYIIISIAAFSTMFSTTIAVVDGYGRAISRTTQLLFSLESSSRRPFIIWTIIISIGAFLVITIFVGNLKQLVDFATILSFVIAPLAGFINYRVIFSKEIAKEFVPPAWLKWLAIAGLIFLSVFTIIYFFVLLDPEGTSQFFKNIL
jgi:Mn2+/Fe2+ NRAMP family transporter